MLQFPATANLFGGIRLLSTIYNSIKTAAVLALALTTSEALADEYLETAQELIACAPPLAHGLQLIAETGDIEMYNRQEGTLLGLYIAAQQSLKNGGYRQDYIDTALNEWTESHMQIFEMRNEDGTYFENAFRECLPVYNGPQLQLVNQWRAEQERAQQ
jgi:hypothetical protein